jgi:hypothetical protein
MIPYLIFAVASFAAQCTPDVLIDDFGKIDVHDYEGAMRHFNLVGGDYGEVGINATYHPSMKNVELTSTNVPDNFWFVKFDLEACFNLNGYTAIEFDIEAPPGTECTFTLTQKSPNCVDRLVDSTYIPLTHYITPNGEKQRVVQPLSEFALNVEGGSFDFAHLKDWTLVGLQPQNVTVKISNFVLKGNCPKATETVAESIMNFPTAKATLPSGASVSSKFATAILLFLLA